MTIINATAAWILSVVFESNNLNELMLDWLSFLPPPCPLSPLNDDEALKIKATIIRCGKSGDLCTACPKTRVRPLPTPPSRDTET